jgi:Cu(I)/Ag(I) efflux system periplasmic protein CusF
MKSIRAVLIAMLLAVPAAPIHAQSAAAHQATGTVKKVDAGKGVVTLAHDPVKSLKWPAMTMGFTVKDKALIDKLQPGKKVEFEFVQQGKDYVITGVK